MKKLRNSAIAAVLLVATVAFGNFVTNGSSLPTTKRDLTPLPPGADPTRYIAAADYNALMNADLDLRTNFINGTFLGFAPQAVHPTPPVNGSAYNIWVNSANNHPYYTANGTDTDMLAGGGGGGSGTVTSVALTAPSIIAVSGSPITTSGTIGLSLNIENANLVFAGPGTGAAQVPTFRSLVAADIPSLSASYLPLTGGTLIGNLTLTGTSPIIQGDPSDGIIMYEGSSHNSQLSFQAGSGSSAQINFQTGDVNIFSTQANSNSAIALLVNTNAAWTDPNAEVADFGSGGVTYLGIMAADGALTSTLPVIVRSYTASGSGAIAQEIDTTTTWSAGHLLNFQNNTAVKAFVDFNGTYTLASGTAGADFSAGSGAFKTSTGANTFDGSSNTYTGTSVYNSSSTSTPVLDVELGSTNNVQALMIHSGIGTSGIRWQFDSAGEFDFTSSVLYGAGAWTPALISTNENMIFGVTGEAFSDTTQAAYTFSSGGITTTRSLVNLKAEASQTGPILELTNSSGSNLFSFSATGMQPGTDNTYPLGGITKRVAGVFNSGIASCGFAAESGTTYSANATTDCQVGLTNTAARTVTLPAASTVTVGQYFELMDEAGTAGIANISAARSGSDTINGSASTLAVVKTNTKSSKCTAISSSAYFCTVN